MFQPDPDCNCCVCRFAMLKAVIAANIPAYDADSNAIPLAERYRAALAILPPQPNPAQPALSQQWQDAIAGAKALGMKITAINAMVNKFTPLHPHATTTNALRMILHGQH